MSVPDQGSFKTTVGIDIAKAHVDVAISGQKDIRRIGNDAEGHAEIASLLSCVDPALIVMEATGGYEVPLAVALQVAGLPVAVVNPGQARDFAKAMGKLARTGRVDAMMLAQSGAVQANSDDVARFIRRPRDAHQEWLAALVTRRRQLLRILPGERQRLEMTPRALHCSIHAVIDVIQAQIKDIDGQMTNYAGQHYRELDKLLHPVCGIGPTTRATLIAELPEPGHLTRRQIASLASVAPFARASGSSKGRRSIQGGRFDVRRTPCMAALTAARYNPPIRAFHERLLAAGKLPKVALVACMRKLLTVINAMARDNRHRDTRRYVKTVSA